LTSQPLFFFGCALSTGARRIWRIIHIAQKSKRKFVQFYHLLLSRNYAIIIVESEGRVMIVFIIIDDYTNEIKGVYTTCTKAQEWIDQMAKEYDNAYRYSIKKYWAI